MSGDIPIGFAVEFVDVSEATKKYAVDASLD